MTGFLAESAHHGCHRAMFVRESAGLQVMGRAMNAGTPYWHAVARVLVRAEGLPEPLYLASLPLRPQLSGHPARRSRGVRADRRGRAASSRWATSTRCPCMIPIRRPRPGTWGTCNANSTAAPPRALEDKRAAGCRRVVRRPDTDRRSRARRPEIPLRQVLHQPAPRVRSSAIR